MRAPVTIDRTTRDLLDVADRGLGILREIVECIHAGELLQLVTVARDDLDPGMLEDTRLAVRGIADDWNMSAQQSVPEPQSLRVAPTAGDRPEAWLA